MKPEPALTVVMPAYNAGRYIDDALQSLCRQTCRDLEVIVIDDGSTDDTAERVASFARPEAEPEIRLIRQTRHGVSAARNAGIDAARGAFVGFLDADDRWEPDMVKRHLALYAAHPDLHLSFAGFRFVDEAGRDLYEITCPPDGPVSLAKLLVRNCIQTSTVVARRDTLRSVSGFDPQLRFFEDYDLWLRIATLSPDGIRGIALPLADYRRHDGQSTRDWRAMHEGWNTVIRRHAALHPQIWAECSKRARGIHFEYCTALAYNAGDIASMRRLLRRSWSEGGLRMASRYSCWLMTGICLATYLPRPLQIVLGRSLMIVRRTRQQIAEGLRP